MKSGGRSWSEREKRGTRVDGEPDLYIIFALNICTYYAALLSLSIKILYYFCKPKNALIQEEKFIR